MCWGIIFTPKKKGFFLSLPKNSVHVCTYLLYGLEESVLLGTKPLVDSIRHFIRDSSGVFSVCHLCECLIVQWRHDCRLLLLLNFFLASRLLFRIKALASTFASISDEKVRVYRKTWKRDTKKKTSYDIKVFKEYPFAIKPSRICKTWLLWNTIKSEIFNI